MAKMVRSMAKLAAVKDMFLKNFNGSIGWATLFSHRAKSIRIKIPIPR